MRSMHPLGQCARTASYVCRTSAFHINGQLLMLATVDCDNGMSKHLRKTTKGPQELFSFACPECTTQTGLR